MVADVDVAIVVVDVVVAVVFFVVGAVFMANDAEGGDWLVGGQSRDVGC